MGSFTLGTLGICILRVLHFIFGKPCGYHWTTCCSTSGTVGVPLYLYIFGIITQGYFGMFTLCILVTIIFVSDVFFCLSWKMLRNHSFQMF